MFLWLFGFGCLGLEGACADDDADGQGNGVDGRRDRIGPCPAPYGAEGLHEHADGRQHDQREPFEHVIDAAGDEPVGHGVGGCRCIGWIVGHVCSDRKNNGDAVTRIIG